MSTEITTAAVETLALHLQEYWARSARRREPIIWADLARDILALIGGRTDAEVKAKALEEAAEEFASRLPDGTGNGRAYNSWRVAEILRARAAAIRGEQ